MASRQDLRLHLGGGGGGSPCSAQNFTKHDPTITPAMQATTFMKKKPPRLLFTGRFGALTGRPGDLIKNLETPGKTGRVGRYEIGSEGWSWRLGIYGFIERTNGVHVFACLSILPLISFFTNCFLMFKHFFQNFFLSVVLSRLQRKNDRRNNIAL